MNGLSFPWIFIGLAAVVDVVGLLYLWRRRNSTMVPSHRIRPSGGGRLQFPLAERRRRDRRGAGAGKVAAV